MNDHTTFLKQCRKCSEWLPATNEHFAKYKNKSDGLYSVCKPCCVKKTAEWRKNNPGKRLESDRARKDADPEKEKERRRNEHLRRLEREGREPWQFTRREGDEASRRRQSRDDYRLKHPDRYKESRRKWDRENIDKKKENGRKWRQNNPIKVRLKTLKRIALKKGAEGSHTDTEMIELYEAQDGLCAYCGVRIFWNIAHDVHQDHVIPLSKGGSDYIQNIALTCQYCNLSKGHKLLDDWIKKRGW